MQLGISLKGQNFTSSLVENDISSNTQLTKGRPYLIFWLGQVCFDAVKARQNDQGLCWTSDRYFLPSYWAASFGEGSLPHCSKVRWQPGRLGGKSRLQILGENLGLVKRMGGLSVGVLFSRTAAGFCPVGSEGA